MHEKRQNGQKTSQTVSFKSHHLDINLIRLIEGKNAYIALCHSKEDAIKMNTKKCLETLKKLDLTIANSLAFEARKAIVARNYDYRITSHLNEEILAEFNKNYPETPCTKVVVLGKNKLIMRIIFSEQDEAKTIAKDGFSLFHVRVPAYNIQIDEFNEVPMCMRCYKLNAHPTRRCPATEDVCSECAVTGHRHTDCTSATKKCLNCNGDHRTTAPQCPSRKQEANNMRRSTAQSNVREGVTYSSAAQNGLPTMQTPNFMNMSMLKMSSAIMYAHSMNAVFPGTFNTELNKVLALNNLPQMIFPDNPPSAQIITKFDQMNQANPTETRTIEPMETVVNNTQISAPSTPTKKEKTVAKSSDDSPLRKKKKTDPRFEHSSDKMGLQIFTNPKTQFIKPKTVTWVLPKDSYKFIYTNEEYKKEEVTELLKNAKILLHPGSIHVSTSAEDYRKLNSGLRKIQSG